MLNLQKISDRIEIYEALIAYSHALDHPGRRWDKWLSCFSPDACCEYPGIPPCSPDKLKEIFSANDTARRSTQHLFSNIVMDIMNDVAEVRSECLYFAVNNSETGTNNQLINGSFWFADLFKRKDGAWRIVHRVVHTRWMRKNEIVS